MVVKSTEREVAGWLSQAINEILGRGGYPFMTSTIETGLTDDSSGSRFPDIVIWKNLSARTAFAVIEIKPPNKQENIDRLPIVMARLNIQYAITWNFNEGRLYYLESDTLEDKSNYPTYLLSSLDDWVKYDKQIAIRKCLRDFLDDLKDYYERGHKYKLPPNRFYFVRLLRETSDKLFSIFENHIVKQRRSKVFSENLDAYIKIQGLPDLDSKSANELIARHWVYGLITKLIFYLTIRRHFSELPDIINQSRDSRNLNDIINAAFNRARQIDWQAIFEHEDFVDNIKIPEECDDILRDLLIKLDEYSFAKLKEDVIGEIFEYIIPDDRKHELGQYFTREDLVDFIIGFVVQAKDGQYCDPTCGSGTFLNRVYSRLKWLTGYGKEHSDILPKIWGFDIAKFPAELATINLVRHDLANFKNFPRIKVTDFFDIRPGQSYEFPLAKGSRELTKVNIPIPNFDGMIGNFPFIRQEQIEKKIKGYKRKITEKIALDWFREYRDIFETSKITKSEYEKIKSYSDNELINYINSFTNGKKFDLKLSGQADIYAYLFVHSAKFLTKDGRMGFITSNSYLDVSYGYELKKFFLDKFKIVAVVASWTEPWFDFASVNTIFTILEKCDNPKERAGNVVKFVKLKKKLADLIPYPDLETQDDQRWAHIDKLVSEIESARPPRGVKANKSAIIEYSESENFHIRLIPQKLLTEELLDNGEFAKWGKYLRAPEIYFEILEKIKDKLVPLNEIAEIRRGYTTGINDFFYLEPTGKESVDKDCINVQNTRGWKGDIEKKFLKPVIKSPKESESIVINKSGLNYKLFYCNASKDELKKNGYIKTLKYIEWGENQKTDDGSKWPSVPSVRSREFWWALGKRDIYPIMMQMVNNDRYLVFINECKVYADHNLFELNINKANVALVAALLNSSFIALNRELISRINLGDGATKTEGVDWSNNILIPNPDSFTKKQIEQILKYFNALVNRTILEINSEVLQPDRIAFDSAILKAMGLDPKIYLQPIYDGLCQLVEERLSLPKMRKKIANGKLESGYKEAKRQVEVDVLNDGLKKFPEAFIEGIPPSKLDYVNNTGTPMRIGHHFFGKYEIIDETGKKIYDADGLDMARYIICAFKKNEFMIDIPKNSKDITKAVNSYQRYIKSMFEKLYERAYTATNDHKVASRLALELLREYGYYGDFELGS